MVSAMTIPLKDYRKAYYKKIARSKIEVSFENGNTEVAKFLFHNCHEKYLDVFGDTITPLVQGSTEKVSFGVVRNGENIIAVFSTDGSGGLYGDIEGITLPRKIEETLGFYHVDRCAYE